MSGNIPGLQCSWETQSRLPESVVFLPELQTFLRASKNVPHICGTLSHFSDVSFVPLWVTHISERNPVALCHNFLQACDLTVVNSHILIWSPRRRATEWPWECSRLPQMGSKAVRLRLANISAWPNNRHWETRFAPKRDDLRLQNPHSITWSARNIGSPLVGDIAARLLCG